MSTALKPVSRMELAIWGLLGLAPVVGLSDGPAHHLLPLGYLLNLFALAICAGRISRSSTMLLRAFVFLVLAFIVVMFPLTQALPIDPGAGMPVTLELLPVPWVIKRPAYDSTMVKIMVCYSSYVVVTTVAMRYALTSSAIGLIPGCVRTIIFCDLALMAHLLIAPGGRAFYRSSGEGEDAVHFVTGIYTLLPVYAALPVAIFWDHPRPAAPVPDDTHSRL
jgi:hypothetical protein